MIFTSSGEVENFLGESQVKQNLQLKWTVSMLQLVCHVTMWPNRAPDIIFSTRENVQAPHRTLSQNLNSGPSCWEVIVLTTAPPCHLEMFTRKEKEKGIHDQENSCWNESISASHLSLILIESQKNPSSLYAAKILSINSKSPPFITTLANVDLDQELPSGSYNVYFNSLCSWTFSIYVITYQ